MASVKRKYYPRVGRTKGYKTLNLREYPILERKPQAVTSPKIKEEPTLKQLGKANIAARKRQAAWTGGNCGIKATKRAFHVEFGRRK